MQIKSTLTGIVPAVMVWLYFQFIIDPRLIYHAQEPAFLSGYNFYSDFAAYPGGLVWYASAFLTQWYQVLFAGATIVTLILFLTVWQTAAVLRKLGISAVAGHAALLPTLLLFSAFANYRFPCAYALGFLLSLVCVNVYLHGARGNRFVRLMVYTLLATAAYYCCGMGVLIVTAVCAAYDIVKKKDVVSGIVMICIAALLPLIASRYVFVISTASAYGDVIGITTSLLAAAQYPRASVLVYCVYGAVIVLTFTTMFAVYWKPRPGAGVMKWRNIWPKRRPGRIAVNAIGSMVVIVTALVSCDIKARNNYQIDAWARSGAWGAIVKTMTSQRLHDYSILSQAHLFRALYRENCLLSDLFAYPDGLPGKAFMAVTGPMSSRFPLQMSDCCFEVGALNQAEFWAHEALALHGKTPWLLERLATINAIKGNERGAGKFIALLEKTMLHDTEVRQCRALLHKNSGTFGTVELDRIKAYAPHKEYLCRDYYSELVNLFDQTSENRIAFEYIVAHNLINNFVSPVVDNTGYFVTLGYNELPRHIQEAAVVQLSVSRATTTKVSGFSLRSDIIERFNQFNQLMERFGSDRVAGLNACAAEFGTTYWFYLMRSGRPVVLERKE